MRIVQSLYGRPESDRFVAHQLQGLGMGEARRRKESDPTFGKVPKDAGQRGLVVSPPLEIDGTRLRMKSSALDPQELRFALLFWDKLVWPSSRVIYIDGGPDEEFLTGAGVLSRPDYTFNGDGATGIALGQIKAFNDLNAREPGAWSLAHGENSFQWKDGFLEEDTGTLVELHRAIPIPKHDVPLPEILEFRHRRRAELLLLRHEMDSFVAEIEKAGDKEDALKHRLGELDKACADLLKVGKEWRFPVNLSDFKASFSFNLAKAVRDGAGAWLAATQAGVPMELATVAAVAGVAGAADVTVKGDLGLRAMRRPMSPYKYAYRIQQELT